MKRIKKPGGCFELKLTRLVVSLCVIMASSSVMASNYGGKKPVVPMAAGSNFIVTGEQITSRDQSCTRVWVNIKGMVTGDSDDGGGLDNVLFEIWDDGALKDSKTVSVPVNSTVPVDVTLGFDGQYQQGASGIGVYGYEVGLDLDPFYPTEKVGSCSKIAAKCWVTPSFVKPGETVTFGAEFSDGASLVSAYIGDSKIVDMTDTDGDHIFEGEWKVPTTSLPGWNRKMSIKGITELGPVWCLGVNVERGPGLPPF